MNTALLIIVVGMIIGASIIFVVLWNGMPEECDEECALEPRRIGSGQGAQGIFEPNRASSNLSLELTQKLKNARDILSENQDIIPWTGLGVSTSEKAVTISIDDKNPEDYRKIIEKFVGSDIPVIIKKGGDPFINSDWITGEDYCDDWCDQNELNAMECDESILAHITKYSNLLDEEFNGKYAIEDERSPYRVSKEKFQECVDFIYEKRILMGFERKILECYGIFNCNVSSQYFESCIDAKKNGVTIEQLCLDSDIMMDDGCATIVFPDGTKIVSCHYEG